MPIIGITSIKVDVDSLFIARDSGGTLFVDKNWPAASNLNDGLSATFPKSTINGALLAAGSGWTIRIAPGSYNENVIVPVGMEGLRLIGRSRDGAAKTSIAPAVGVPLKLQCGYLEVMNLELVDTAIAGGDPNNVCLHVTGPQSNIHDLSLVGNSAGVWGTWLDGTYRTHLENIYLDNKYILNSIGILFGATVIGSSMKHCQINKCGSGLNDGGADNGYGIAFANSSQENIVEENDIIDSYVGIYHYGAGTPYKANACVHNTFSENTSWDAYDPNLLSVLNLIDENFYSYVGWNDPTDDGLSLPVDCGVNYDLRPLTSKYGWKSSHVPRRLC